jgi:hypothetical protein
MPMSTNLTIFVEMLNWWEFFVTYIGLLDLNLNLHYARKFYVNLRFSGLVVLEVFKWLFPIFCNFVIIFYLKGPSPLSEQFWIPFTKTWFVPSFIEIGLLVLEKAFFKIFSVLLLFFYFSPLDKGVPLHSNKLEQCIHYKCTCINIHICRGNKMVTFIR